MITYNIYIGSRRSLHGTEAVYTIVADAYDGLRRVPHLDVTLSKELKDMALPESYDQQDRQVRADLCEMLAKFFIGVTTP